MRALHAFAGGALGGFCHWFVFLDDWAKDGGARTLLLLSIIAGAALGVSGAQMLREDW